MALIYFPSKPTLGKVNQAVLDKESGLLFEPQKVGNEVLPALNVVNPETIKKLLAKGFKVYEEKKTAPTPTPTPTPAEKASK